MHKQLIDKIVWWIPIRGLRDFTRNYLNKINKNKLAKLPNKHLYYTEDYGYWLEEQFISSFYKVLNSSNFEEKYSELISNLDRESIDAVNTIIKRLKTIEKSNSSYFDFFTDKEKDFLNYATSEYPKHVTKQSEDKFLIYDKFLPDVNIGSTTFYYESFITQLYNIEILKDKCFIDVGGYIGDSILTFTKYTNRQIYSFEPIARNFELLKKTIDYNNFKNVIAVNKALGAIEEELLLSDDHSSSSFNKPVNDKSEKVHVTTLDKFVDENGLKNIGLIKVDIEGFEQEFLKGAINTITTQKPVLLLSIYHGGSDFFDIKPIIESWNLGYKFKIRQQFCGTIFTETLLIAELLP